MADFLKIDGSRPLVVQRPHAFTELHAMSKARDMLEQLLQEEVAKAQDAALTIGLEGFKPGLVKQVGLLNLKKQLRFTDMLDGDHMIYWQSTNELIMFLQAPQIDFSNGQSPKMSVGYRIPTTAERQQLAELGRNVELP